MSHVLDALLLFLGLLVGLWMVVFGLLGLILSDRSGVPRSVGVLVGIALGPIGVGWLLWKSRRSGATSYDTSPDRDTVDDADSGLLF